MTVSKFLDPQIVGPNSQEISNRLGGVWRGSVTLSSGVASVSAPITDSTVIVASLKTAGGTLTSTANYGALSGSRDTSAGTFVVAALTSAAEVDTANESVVDVIAFM